MKAGKDLRRQTHLNPRVAVSTPPSDFERYATFIGEAFIGLGIIVVAKICLVLALVVIFNLL